MRGGVGHNILKYILGMHRLVMVDIASKTKFIVQNKFNVNMDQCYPRLITYDLTTFRICIGFVYVKEHKRDNVLGGLGNNATFRNREG